MIREVDMRRDHKISKPSMNLGHRVTKQETTESLLARILHIQKRLESLEESISKLLPKEHSCPCGKNICNRY